MKISSNIDEIMMILTFLGADPGTGELSVIHLNLISLHGFLHGDQSVSGHLVTEPSAATVDHQHHLPRTIHTHLVSSKLVIDLINNLPMFNLL